MPGFRKQTSGSKIEDRNTPERRKLRSLKLEESSSSPASSLSVLDIDLTKQLVSVAETAIKNHLKMQKKASKAPSKSDDDDDEIQVISEKTTNPKPNQTVLQLGLPKVSKFFILVSKS